MNLKNYTSNVSVDRTVARIENVLARAAVKGIQKEYDGFGGLTALQFMVELGPQKRPVSIRLPVNVDAVYKCMAAEVKRPHKGTMDRIKEQAGRTAWKLMQDWVEVQISLIIMQQAEWLQVFLPYIWDRDSQQDFFHMLKAKQFKALPGIGET
jgi:hypothetical protein